MDHNPYSPPQTEVRELPDPGDAVPRPGRVTLALWFLWVEFALSATQAVVQLSTMTGRRGFGIVVGVGAAVLVVEAVVIQQLALRRNWARYVTLIASILGLLQFFGVLARGQKIDPVVGGLEVVQLVLDGMALFLLFTSPAKQWYKRR